jgi:TetR/AcrR family transcriptional repressor of nem operon
MSHLRILTAAGTLLQERGVENLSIRDVMSSVGLTHGGFYSHFASKDDLITRACEVSFMALTRAWLASAAVCEKDAVVAIARTYLSKRHRDGEGESCILAALGAEAGRKTTKLKGVFGCGVEAYLRVLRDLLKKTPGGGEPEAEHAVLAQMVGSLVLARLAREEDLSDVFLESGIRRIEEMVRSVRRPQDLR